MVKISEIKSHEVIDGKLRVYIEADTPSELGSTPGMRLVDEHKHVIKHSKMNLNNFYPCDRFDEKSLPYCGYWTLVKAI